MQFVLAIVAGTTLLLVGAVHIYWLFGGQWGIKLALPLRSDGMGPLFTPRKFETGGVALLLWLAAISLLMQAGVVPMVGPVLLHRIIGWVLAIVFLLRAIGEFRYMGFFKRHRSSAFATMDTRFYSPLCLALSLATFIILLS